MSKKRPRIPQNAASGAAQVTGIEETAGQERRPILAAGLLGLALVVYGGWFFAQQLDDLTRDPAAPWLRFHYFLFLISVAPEVWSERWFGGGSWELADRAGIAVTTLCIVTLAWSAGSIAMRLVQACRGLSLVERLGFATGLGLNLVSLAVLLLGLVGLTQNRAVVLCGAALAIAAAGWFAWRDRKLNSIGEADSNDVASQPSDRPVLWLLALAAPFVAVILFGGMLPPSDFDVREYHLQAPKEFYQLGRITFLPHNVYANMPLGSEMHSLLGMTLLGDWWTGALVGKTVQACCTLLTALLLFAAGRRWYSTLAGILAAVVYLSTPWIVHVATAGLVEGAAAFYCFATLYAWLLWRDAQLNSTAADNSRRGRISTADSRLLLTGLLAGSAVATKYPAALFVVVPFISLVAWYGGAERVRSIVLFVLMVTITCGPWLAKNAYFTGNPTYPLLYSVFGGATWNREKDTRWQAAHRPTNFSIVDTHGRSTDLLDSIANVIVRSPWLNLFTWPLAAMTLLSAARAGKHRDRRAMLLWGYLLFVLVAWWLFTHRIDRFWIPILPVASLLAGIGATTYAGRAWWSVIGVALLLGLSYDFAAVATNTGPGSSNRFFVSLAKLKNDPERIPAWQQWLNQNTPQGKRVLCEGDAQVFDLEMPILYHTAFDDSPLIALVKGKSPDEIGAALTDVAFVYVNSNEISRYRSPGNYGFSDEVRPEVLEDLVRQKILGPPIEQFRAAGVEIYPVQ